MLYDGASLLTSLGRRAKGSCYFELHAVSTAYVDGHVSR